MFCPVHSFMIDSFFTENNFYGIFQTFSDEGFERESIVLRGIPRKVGCYPLERRSPDLRINEIPSISYSLSGSDGDVLIGSYTLNPMHRDSNLIELTEIDTINRRVYDRLGASFVLRDTSINFLHPNFIRLFNPEIEATYE